MCHGKYMNANNHLVVQKGNKSKNKSLSVMLKLVIYAWTR
jgi:hypothetical protein